MNTHTRVDEKRLGLRGFRDPRDGGLIPIGLIRLLLHLFDHRQSKAVNELLLGSEVEIVAGEEA